MPDDIKSFLDGLDPALRDIATALRQSIREELPDAVERTHGGWKVIGYSLDGSMRSTICAIAPHSAHVNLQLFRGLELAEEFPELPLEGSGKQGRHVKLRSPDDAWRPELRALIRRARELAGAR